MITHWQTSLHNKCMIECAAKALPSDRSSSRAIAFRPKPGRRASPVTVLREGKCGSADQSQRSAPPAWLRPDPHAVLVVEHAAQRSDGAGLQRDCQDAVEIDRPRHLD